MNDFNLLKQIEYFIKDILKMGFFYLCILIENSMNFKKIYTSITEEYQKEKKFEDTILPTTFFAITVAICFFLFFTIDATSMNKLGSNTILLINTFSPIQLTLTGLLPIFTLCTLFFLSPVVASISIYQIYQKNYIIKDKTRILDIQLIFHAILWLFFAVWLVIASLILKFYPNLSNSFHWIYAIAWIGYFMIGETILIHQEITSFKENKEYNPITIPIINRTLILTENHSKILFIYIYIFLSILAVLAVFTMMLQ